MGKNFSMLEVGKTYKNRKGDLVKITDLFYDPKGGVYSDSVRKYKSNGINPINPEYDLIELVVTPLEPEISIHDIVNALYEYDNRTKQIIRFSICSDYSCSFRDHKNIHLFNLDFTSPQEAVSYLKKETEKLLKSRLEKGKIVKYSGKEWIVSVIHQLNNKTECVLLDQNNDEIIIVNINELKK